MGIALDAETESIARQLAKLRGGSVEEAVKSAIRAELARAESARPGGLPPIQQANVDKMMSIVKSLPALPSQGDDDPTAFLYDDLGLPR